MCFMNKRGDTTVWEEIVKAIPAMMIVLLLVWAGVKIWNSTHPEKFSIEKKDLKRLSAEIKDLKNGDEIYVPVFSTSSYTTQLIDMKEIVDKGVYSGCSKDYCVCFLKSGSPFVCETFDIDMKIFSYKESECDKIIIASSEDEKLNQIKLTRTGVGAICNINLVSSKPKTQNPIEASPIPNEPSSTSPILI